MARLTEKQALERLMSWCASSEKSPFEAEKKLKTWGLSDHSESIITQLIEENFINTTRFAEAFARDKMRFNKWGTTKIRFQLRGHQIDDTTINHALDLIETEEYQAMLFAEMGKKLKSIKTKDKYQQKAKLFAFGCQRGYEPDMINQFFEDNNLL